MALLNILRLKSSPFYNHQSRRPFFLQNVFCLSDKTWRMCFTRHRLIVVSFWKRPLAMENYPNRSRWSFRAMMKGRRSGRASLGECLWESEGALSRPVNPLNDSKYPLWLLYAISSDSVKVRAIQPLFWGRSPSRGTGAQMWALLLSQPWVRDASQEDAASVQEGPLDGVGRDIRFWSQTTGETWWVRPTGKGLLSHQEAWRAQYVDEPQGVLLPTEYMGSSSGSPTCTQLRDSLARFPLLGNRESNRHSHRRLLSRRRKWL